MRVQWQTPSDGGMGISNYTLTLTSQEETLASVSSEGDLARSERTVSNPKILFLNYTTNYSVVVTANNCVGNSSSSILVLSQGQCYILFIIIASNFAAFVIFYSPFLSQPAAVVHLFQSMAVLRSTGVQRREHRSSSTVTRATLPVSATHHNAPTQHGPQTLNH